METVQTRDIEALRATVEALEKERHDLPLAYKDAERKDRAEADAAHRQWREARKTVRDLPHPAIANENQRAVARREEELGREIDIARIELLTARRAEKERERDEYQRVVVAQREAAHDQAAAELEAAKEAERRANHAVSDSHLHAQKLMEQSFRLQHTINHLRQKWDLPR